jgi:hypothetical protein
MKNFLNPVSSPIESVLKMPILISVLVLYQGILSSHSKNVPTRIEKLLEYKIFRLFSLFVISVVITRDVEYALISMLIFLTSLYAIKTPEERKNDGFI